MNEEEFFTRMINKICKDYGYDVATTFELLYMKKDKEIERLKNGYCKLKVKCNNGECDCTNEEYDGMAQSNMKGALKLEHYKSRIDKAIEYIHNHQLVFELSSKKQIQYWFDEFYKDLLNILKGSDK